QSMIRSDYSKEYRIIEPPSFTTIDGQRTGTFLYTVKDNYPENSPKLAVQHWITFKDGVGYDIMYVSTPDTFDNPDEKAIRDNLIKSIKFTGGNNMTNINNSTSRFN